MAKPTTKATRVQAQELDLMARPVCRRHIVGTVTVEAHLGELSLALGEQSASGVDVTATQDVKTRVREFRVTHVCQPLADDVTPRTGDQS